MKSPRPLALTVLTAVALLVPGSALAQAELQVAVRETTLELDGATRILVSVTGEAVDGTVLDAGAFAVTEGTDAVTDVEVTPLLESEPSALGVMLVVDVSGSTAGAPLDSARAAASEFAAGITAAGGNVGVVSFGPTAQLLAPPAVDVAAATAALAGLTAEGETALYDGILVAAEALREFDGVRQIVVFSDGADTVSTATLDEASAAAADLEAPVTTVALATDALDRSALAGLADATSGRVIEAGASDDLAGAFDTAAAVIASQYVLTYSRTPTESAELDLTVTVTTPTATASDRATVVNPRRAPSGGPVAVQLPEPSSLARPESLWVGLGAAFLALAVVIGFIVVSVRDETETRRLQRSLRAYSTGGTSHRRSHDLDPSAISRRAAEFVDRMPKPAGFEDALQRKIDQAAWPLRASEFLVTQMGTGVAGAALAWALTANPIFGVLGGVVAAIAPRVVLDHRVSKRSAAFMDQLPDTLGLLAGSLRAGYGLVQAVDTVVREASSPTSEEFARALTETRLGMPLSEALEGMAERTASEDFGWVVMAINIQNEVGGNLAQLLETVANTLREREQVRRQVRTLSAEGKLSAYVLIGLVPMMGAYMFSVNRGYVSLLWTTSMGRTLLMVGLALLTVGIIGIRKVIQIDV